MLVANVLYKDTIGRSDDKKIVLIIFSHVQLYNLLVLA